MINIYVREKPETTQKGTRLGAIDGLGTSKRIEVAKAEAMVNTRATDTSNNRSKLLGSATQLKQVGLGFIKATPAISFRAMQQAANNPFTTVTDSILETVAPSAAGALAGIAGSALVAALVPEPISTIGGIITLIGVGAAGIASAIVGERTVSSALQGIKLEKELKFTKRNQAFTRQLGGVAIRGSF